METKKEKVKLSVEMINNYISTWADNWRNSKERVIILKSIKDVANNSDYNSTELKEMVKLEVKERETKEKEKLELTKLSPEEVINLEERKKQAKWLSDKETLHNSKNFRFIDESKDKKTACEMIRIDFENYEKYKKEIIDEEKKKQEEEERIKIHERNRIERQKYDNYNINFVDNDIYNTWKKIKGRIINLIRFDNNERLFFMAHSKNKIVGKAQLVQETKQKIPLIVKVIKTDRKGFVNTTHKFIDDHYDKRYDGHQVESLSFDFWIYRVIEKGKEYFLFSQEEIGNELYTFEGMKIELSNVSEAAKNLKFRSLATIFIVKKATPAVKIINKEEMIQVTKQLKEDFNIDSKSIMDYIFTNPRDNKIYDYTPDYNLLQFAQLFSGKYEGYPLHIMKMGPVGTGKTTLLECLNDKFRERKGILEAGNSTPKALVPSFKEKPASPGYVLSCFRVALIDELMKMINNSNQVSRYVELMQQSLGQLNMLLEHKERTIGSGNDNSLTAKSTAKVIFSTNPLANKSNIYEHIGQIDATTISRMIVWIQDDEEVKKIYKKEIRENKNTYAIIHTPKKGEKAHVGGGRYRLEYYGGVFINVFISLYDSCQLFICNINEDKVKSIYNESLILSKEPMKQIWKSRGLHHSILILDGIVKFRCLFKDFDETFTPIEQDYDDLERILIHMVKTWDTNLSPNKQFDGF